MKIAVEGCAHGELDKIYECLQVLERRNKLKIDLLIICGDFQAVRNPTDLECISVPPKYRKMNTFYKYYSGEKKAPVLTIFIGGNHEASNYLSELSYGGWVCPNIYYMGYANVINVGGVRIAGLSGIYKGHDYLKGHFESPPYDRSTVKSVYHVRNVDVFRLKQIRKPLDICISHDWPRGVYNHGNLSQLLRFKPFFKDEMQSNKLGNQPAEELLNKLKPSYWFAAHLHCKFTALVPHDVGVTKFLALDKCLPKRRFLQVLDIGQQVDSVHLEYDAEWLSILQNTNHLLNVSRRTSYMPGVGCNERWDFTATPVDLERVTQLFDSNLKVPNNFQQTAQTYVPNGSYPKNAKVKKYLNPQTQAFCKLIKLTDPNEAVSLNESISIQEFSGTSSASELSFSTVPSSNPEEICYSDEEEVTEKDVTPKNEDLLESADFFIDRTGTPLSSNKEQFLQSQFCSTPVNTKPNTLESFPEIKQETALGLTELAAPDKPFVFKQRNFSLYSNPESSSVDNDIKRSKF